MRKIVRTVLFILFVMIFVGCAGYLAYNRYKNIQEEKVMEELREKKKAEARAEWLSRRAEELEEQQKEMEQIVQEKEKEKKQKEEAEILTQYKNLYKENSDLVGWIKIEGTVIDYPVMQTAAGPDFNYYLHKDWNKEDSNEGTPFLDYRNDIRKSNNLVIYGHNMKAGTMFGSLKKYKEKKYYEANPIINFDTLYEKGQYQVIGVVITDYTQQPISYDDDPNYSTKEEFETYVKNIKENSLYEIEETAEYGDKLISLVTCNRLSANDEKTRLIVVAKKIK